MNGYAYTSIPVDGNEDWNAHMDKLRADQGEVPWYKWLRAIFMPGNLALEKESMPGKRFLLLDLEGGRQNWIWKSLQWWRMFHRSDGIKRWRKLDLPAYLAGLDRWQTLKPAAATNEELLRGIHDLTVVEARYWHVLRRIIGAAKGTDMALQMFCEKNAPDRGFASGTFSLWIQVKSRGR